MALWNAARRAEETTAPAEAVCRVAGVALRPVVEGAVWWPETETLIVADLHLEKGSAFAARGQMLPPYDTSATLSRLAALLARLQPRRVIALGDSFHDRGAEGRMAEADRGLLAMLAASAEWIWIAGNHDPDPPKGIAGWSTSELSIGPLTFRHAPRAGASPGEIAGHLHPAARLVGRGRSIRRRCFATDGRRLVMPAFGSLAGGLNVLDAAFRPLFDGNRFHALMLGEAVHAIAARRLAFE